MKIWYTVPDHDEVSRYSCEVSTSTTFDDLDYQAEICAENYNDEHDGWESTWPLTIALFASEDGPEIARFKVEQEFSPVYRAAVVEKEEIEE